jgi:hypothetical protein
MEGTNFHIIHIILIPLSTLGNKIYCDDYK